MSKRILFFILFSWLASAAFPAFAQQKADTTYTFRFVPQKDMFYVPWNGNDTELARLLECVRSFSQRRFSRIRQPSTLPVAYPDVVPWWKHGHILFSSCFRI